MSDKTTGIMFYNTKKSSPNAPDFSGRVEMDDDFLSALAAAPRDENGKVVLRLAGWRKTSAKSGNDFISLSAEPMREAQGGGGQRSSGREEPSRGKTFNDDEIPF